MQNYFLRPFAQSKEPASALTENSIKLKKKCESYGVPIAYTAQPGDMTQEERGLLKDFWGPGMKASAEDRQIIEPLSPSQGDWLLTKWRYSAFVKTDLLKKLHEAGRDQIIICGVYAHVGILTTALEAFSSDIQSFIVSDATADFSHEDHSMALDYAAKRCSMVVTTEQILTSLEF